VILHLLKTGLSQTWHDPPLSGINHVQELYKTHHQITLARTRVPVRSLWPRVAHF
jgi:hypothetical protein